MYNLKNHQQPHVFFAIDRNFFIVAVFFSAFRRKRPGHRDQQQRIGLH